MSKKRLSKGLREALLAIDRLDAGDYEQLLAWQAYGGEYWRSLSDLVTLWGFAVPRGWPAPSGTCEELNARREAKYEAERKLERARYRDERRRRRGASQDAGTVH